MAHDVQAPNEREERKGGVKSVKRRGPPYFRLAQPRQQHSLSPPRPRHGFPKAKTPAGARNLLSTDGVSSDAKALPASHFRATELASYCYNQVLGPGGGAHFRRATTRP